MTKLQRWVLVAALLALAIFGCAFASAETGGTDGNITWTLSDDGVLTISGNGAMNDYSTNFVDGDFITSAPWGRGISATSINILDGVTSIGDCAFYGCTGLTSITIPDSVTSIGNAAFSVCTGLTSINVSIDNQSYSSINGILFNKDKTTLITFPEGYKGAYTIPSSVTSIGYSVFSECDGLTSVTIPDSVTSIGDCAFYNCDGLTSITIPDSVTSIGDFAFFGCFTLTSITIPDSVTSIGDNAFTGCTGLTSINVSIDNPSYSSINGILFNKDKTTLITFPGGYKGAYTIPNSVTSIGYSAFSECTGLTSVTIPDSVTSIGDYAFYYCTDLTSITIPDSVTSIGYWAFNNCTDLTSATILNPYCTIGDRYVFAGCADSFTLRGWNPSTARMYAESTGHTFESLGDITPTTGKCGDNVTWVFNSSTSMLTISGTGAMTDYNSSDAVPWDYCRQSVASVSIDSGVTSIGDYAFSGCDGLTSITIPDSVTSIGDYAFSNCTGLTSVTIPDSVTSIGDYAFYYCTGLTSITIPDSVTSIGDNAFSNCDGLTSITIPDSVTSIGDYAFCNCTGLTSITIPDSVTSIGDCAFYNCDGLTSITIPDSVTSIGDWAFSGCTSLTSITIPDSVTSIGDLAFDYCTGLTSITIPDSVTSIGDYAFNNCSGLTSINVSTDNPSYSSINGILFNKDKTTLIALPGGYKGTYTIPNSVTSISDYAFNNCTGLTSITIPDSVTSIGNSTFSECTGLTSITIPDSVTRIGDNAFSNCDGLTSITIPDSVISIGNSTFSVCTGLTSITIPDSVTSIGDAAFSVCTGLTEVTVLNPYCTIGGSGHDVFEDTAASFVLRGWNSSTARMYAESVGHTFESLGDFTPTGKCGDNVTWVFNSSTSMLTISGTGAMTDYSSSDEVPWNAYRQYVASVSIDSGVTSIGDSAFCYCTGLTSITIPDSVTSIGDYAFLYCTGLTEVTVLNPCCIIGDSGHDVFEDTAASFVLRGYANSTAETYAMAAGHTFEALEAPAPTFILPAGLTTIEDEAFSGISVVAVKIPSGVTSISGNPFAGSGVLFIYGTTGTAAETFANTYEYTFVPVTE